MPNELMNVSANRRSPPTTRIALRLLEMSRHSSCRFAGGKPVVALSQAALAEILGMTRQSLNKELRNLSELGAVIQGYNQIQLVVEVLASVADERD
jgi:CRP-like cAMP-binding protein